MHFTGTTVLKMVDGKIAEEIGLDDGVTALHSSAFCGPPDRHSTARSAAASGASCSAQQDLRVERQHAARGVALRQMDRRIAALQARARAQARRARRSPAPARGR